MNLRKHIATAGLRLSIEGNFGLPCVLISPDGITISETVEGSQLKAQILYDRDGVDPETGEMVVVAETAVILRKSALSRVPLPGEKWAVKIPVNPVFSDTLTTFSINTDRALTGGETLGFIKLYLQELDQL